MTSSTEITPSEAAEPAGTVGTVGTVGTGLDRPATAPADLVARAVTSTDIAVEPPVAPGERSVKVLVYSDDRNTRATIKMSIGRRPTADSPRVEFVETATEPKTVARLGAGDIALAILDGEATPAGGMGICRQIKDEIFDCPPVLVVVGRADDAWLATWSRADGVVSHPIDPLAMARAVARLLAAQPASR